MQTMTSFTSPSAQLLSADWRDQLAKRLGQRPRRLGEWAELAIYGALQCLDHHGIAQLNPQALIRVTSTNGPTQALAQSWLACADNSLPMPFDFLQSQPSQMLAALSQHLQWQGDATFTSHAHPNTILAQWQSEAQRLQQQTPISTWGGMLMGFVDITPALTSHWYWFV